MRYRNSSSETRTWPWLVDVGTGRTLHLEPGADAEVAGAVDDPWLQAVPDADEQSTVVAAPAAVARVKSPKSTTTKD